MDADEPDDKGVRDPQRFAAALLKLYLDGA